MSSLSPTMGQYYSLIRAQSTYYGGFLNVELDVMPQIGRLTILFVESSRDSGIADRLSMSFSLPTTRTGEPKGLFCQSKNSMRFSHWGVNSSITGRLAGQPASVASIIFNKRLRSAAAGRYETNSKNQSREERIER